MTLAVDLGLKTPTQTSKIFKSLLFVTLLLIVDIIMHQGSHRLEKYLKMKGCLEKYLKTKFALKSAGKLAIGLVKHLNFTSSGIPDNKIRFQNQM